MVAFDGWLLDTMAVFWPASSTSHSADRINTAARNPEDSLARRFVSAHRLWRQPEISHHGDKVRTLGCNPVRQETQGTRRTTPSHKLTLTASNGEWGWLGGVVAWVGW